MISAIEALNFRCLRYVRQSLNSFHVLVGPNASGKTTFLDVIAFLGQLVSDGLDATLDARSHNFDDLVWNRTGTRFELAIEATIPDSLRSLIAGDYDTIRYEVAIGLDLDTSERSILAETVTLRKTAEYECRQLKFFPNPKTVPTTILTESRNKNIRTVIKKVPGGNDNFYSETYQANGKGWAPSFKLGPRKSALGNLPEDESKFPASTWLKQLLAEGVQQFVLNSLLIRKASPPGQIRGFKPDGSNLPWVIDNLISRNEPRYQAWINHVKTALPTIEAIRVVERQDDKHRYLMIRYEGGLEIPSWMASDGTLRFLALTLPAYLPDFRGVYLIEEPENGIHPRAMESMFQSLSSVYDAQILIATHAPVILNIADAQTVLCFAKTANGETDIVTGNEHPALRQWKGETSLGVLFAGGVLG